MVMVVVLIFCCLLNANRELYINENFVCFVERVEKKVKVKTKLCIQC